MGFIVVNIYLLINQHIKFMIQFSILPCHSFLLLYITQYILYFANFIFLYALYIEYIIINKS